jgi:tetratricopeptide (TPR) repeat protein
MKNFFTSIFSFIFIISLVGQNLNLPDTLLNKLSALEKDQQVEYLLDLSNEFSNKSGDQALLYANAAYYLALDISEKEFIQKSLLAKMQAFDLLASYDSVLSIGYMLDSMGVDPEKTIYYKSLKLKSLANFNKSNYALARENIDEVLNYFQAQGDSISVYDAEKIRGDIFVSQGDLSNASNSFFRALRIAEMYQDTVKIIGLYNGIATMYFHLDDFKKAKKFLLKGYEISGGYEKSLSYKRLLSQLGSYYNRAYVFDSAEYFYKKSLDITRKLNARDDIAGAYLNLGNLNCRQKKFENGKAYLDTSLILFKELKLDGNEAKVYDSYSTMYYALNNWDSSLYYAEKSLVVRRKIGFAPGIQSALYRLAAGYDKRGDYKNSLKYAKQYILFTDSIVGDKIQSKIADYEAKYETAKKERDIIKLKAEQKAQKDKVLILWISFSSVSLILLLIVWSIYQKRKKDGIIHQKEQLVLKNKKALADAELEKSKLQEERLKKEIQYKSKQLTTHALNMMQKNTLMQEIQEELVSVSKKANSENKPVLNRIKMLIKKNLRSEKDWDLFKLYFEDVNKNFYDELGKLSPELTSNDIKLCALLKLNMNIKESASVLNIEPASVKTARYKLRKKLGLQPADDLIEFIRKI